MAKASSHAFATDLASMSSGAVALSLSRVGSGVFGISALIIMMSDLRKVEINHARMLLYRLRILTGSVSYG